MKSDEALRALRELRDELSRATHDANNPLTVISGNAQFLNELGPALGLGEEVTGPIADIQTASEELAAALARLNALKAQVTAALEGA